MGSGMYFDRNRNKAWREANVCRLINAKIRTHHNSKEVAVRSCNGLWYPSPFLIIPHFTYTTYLLSHDFSFLISYIRHIAYDCRATTDTGQATMQWARRGCWSCALQLLGTALLSSCLSCFCENSHYFFTIGWFFLYFPLLPGLMVDWGW